MDAGKQIEELNRATEKLADVTRELSMVLEQLMEYERARAYPEEERLSEEEVAALAEEEVHAVRKELWKEREPEGPAPGTGEIEHRWKSRRRP